MSTTNDSNIKPTSQPVPPSGGAVVPPWISSPVPAQPAQTQPSPPKPTTTVKEGETPIRPQPSPRIMIKKSPFAKIIPLLLIICLGLGLFFLVSKVILPLTKKDKNGKSGAEQKEEEITLTYWGLWEQKEIMQPVIDEWQKDHPNIKIQYIQQSYKDFRERLQSALARSEGPDLFRFHLSWLPMLRKELAPGPTEIAKKINLKENYYPVISEKLEVSSQTFGVPLGFDTLALFYNTKIFSQAGKTFPTNWDELRRTASDLCVADSKDKTCKPGEKILTAGVALGATSNVDHFSDILGLMMLQNGVDLSDPTGNLAEDALKFYTLFVTDDGVWDESLPSSIYAFATEKVAMIFAPSWRIHEILQINPNLQFKTAPVPQISEKQIAWATFWVEGVSNKSQNIKTAWEFLDYLSSKDTLVKFYNQASQLRKFGEPYPRLDMASQLEDDVFVGTFVKQGQWAKNWYLCSYTHDNGINDKIIKYFEDAVNKVLKGEGVASALEPAAQGVAQVLNQYGVK